MTDTPKHSVSVAGVVVNASEQVLVIKRRDNGHWEPPGGVLETTETPEAGVVREIREETGIEVVVQNLSGVYKNMEGGIIALVFRCIPVAGAETPSDETSHVAWWNLEQVQQNMQEAYFVRVRDAFEAGVPVRAHDGVNLI